MDPSSNAEAALFTNADPQTVANGMRGNYTPGEKMLLANAKAQRADPAIRARLNADQRAAVQNADRSFTDRVLSTAATPDTGKAVNADAEIAKGSKTTGRRPRKKKRAAAGLTGSRFAAFCAASLIAAAPLALRAADKSANRAKLSPSPRRSIRARPATTPSSSRWPTACRCW